MLNNTLVAKLVSLDITYEREMLEKTDKDSGLWKSVQAGNKSFSISCEGFVVDPYDKNLINPSENFQDSRWVKTGVTISSTLYAAPDGFKKANRTVNFSTGDTIEYNNFSDLETVLYTFSVWAKSVTGTVNLALELGDDDSSDTSAVTATTTWQRFSIVYSMGTGIDAFAKITAGATGEIEIFGAQLELGSTPTTYEPTGNTYAELYSTFEAGTSLTALITDQTSGNITYEGEVKIGSLPRTAPQGQLSTFTCDLTGTGEITKATI
jgi:predicted secreted protein